MIRNTKSKIYYQALIDTALGTMMAVTDDDALYMLEFTNRKNFKINLEKFLIAQQASMIAGQTKITQLIAQELKDYFSGTSRLFHTPIAYYGSDFKKSVYHGLRKITFGTTCSYADLAKEIGKPLAVRAVANANAANQLALIIPCHRIIGSNGSLTGYAGGLARKKWLLEHEKKHQYG